MNNAGMQQHKHNASARAAAQAAVEGLAVKPTSRVEYRCRGRVAVIGGIEAIEFTPHLHASLQAQIILLQGAEEPGVPVIPVAGRNLAIEGYLGAFNIILGEQGKANYQSVDVDLILDLSPSPLLSMPLTPPGYISATTDENSLLAAADQLADLVGTFEKPRYFDYDASICAHGRAGQEACNRCIEACPAEAISALAESIEVNPYLCQGGGVCATVCPSGAIQYAYPRAEDTLEQIRILLRVYRENDGKDPVVAFFSEADGDITTTIADNVIPVLVEELASVGLEVWLSALAYGASAVLLVDAGAMPANVTAEVEKQCLTATEILAAMGYAQNSIRIVRPESLDTESEHGMTAIKPATFSAMGSKRQIAFLAIDHLYSAAAQPKPMANLTVGAPFGMATVDEQRCTLCMSCAGICPGHALQTGEELPQLQFIESNCLQCGLCTRTCPEDAIWITPRLHFARETRNKPRVLHQEEPFCCVTCGKPFATKSMITRMTGKLGAHWMFQDERAKRRLMMCEDCRVADIVQDPQALTQGFETPPRRQ
jgi:ferredoxin